MADVTDIPAGETMDGLGLPDLPPGETPDLIVASQPGALDMLTGSFKGGARQNTLTGAGQMAEKARTMRGAGDNSEYALTERNRRRRTLETLGGGRTDDEGIFNPIAAEEQATAARKSVIEQIAYENSEMFSGGLAGAVGTAAGVMVAPESFLGFGRALAARFPTVFGGATYGRVMLRTGADAAIGNTLTDPLVQGIRLNSGMQGEYNWTQTLLEAPITGLVGGAALGGAGRFVGDIIQGNRALVYGEGVDPLAREMLAAVEGGTTPVGITDRMARAGLSSDNATYRVAPDPDVIDTGAVSTLGPRSLATLSEKAPDAPDLDTPPPPAPSIQSAVQRATIGDDTPPPGFIRPAEDTESLKLAEDLNVALTEVASKNVDVPEEAIVDRALDKILKGEEPKSAVQKAIEEIKQEAAAPKTAQGEGEAKPPAAKAPEQVAPPAQTPPPAPALAGPPKFNMVQTSGKKGTNEGGFFKNEATGEEFYVKFYKDENQSKTEALAGEVYEFFGASTLSPKTGEINGKFGVMTPKSTDLVEITPAQMKNPTPEMIDDLAKIYYSAVMTANRDIVGDSFDNIMLNKKTGRLVQTDLGGSFEFRAQGEPKTYGKDVNDADAFLNPKYSAGKFFNQLSTQAKADLFEAMAKVHVSTDAGKATMKVSSALLASNLPQPKQLLILDNLFAKQYKLYSWILDQQYKIGKELKADASNALKALEDELNSMGSAPSSARLKQVADEKKAQTATVKAVEKLEKDINNDSVIPSNPVKATEVSPDMQKLIPLIEAVEQKKAVTKADLNKIVKATSKDNNIVAQLVADVAKGALEAKPKAKASAFDTIKTLLKTSAEALMPKKDVPTAFTTLKENTAASETSYKILNWVNDLAKYIADYKGAEARLESGLPMDTPARTLRAKAMGFNTEITLYHGTSWAFNQFDLKKSKNGELGIFATRDTDIAQQYGGKYIIPLWAKMESPKVVDWKGHQYSNTYMIKEINAAREAGHDVLIIKNMKDIGGKQDQYIILKPENLRAKHGATFDPTKKDVADLLALKKNRAQLPDFAPTFKDGLPVHGSQTPAGHAPVPQGRVLMVQQIAQELVDDLGLTARIGLTGPGNRGAYKSRSGVIRVYGSQDLEALLHELGHDIHINGGKKQLFDNWVDHHAKELDPLNAGDLSKLENQQEAIAHFFWGYVAAPGYMQRFMPEAFLNFDLIMRSEFPTQMQAVLKARNAIDVFNHAPSVKRVQASQISTQQPTRFEKVTEGAKSAVFDVGNIIKETVTSGGKGFVPAFKEAVARDIDPFGRSVYSTLDNIYAAVIDKAHPIYKAQQALVEIARVNGINVDLKPIDDAYIHARMMPYSYGRAAAQLARGVLMDGLDHVGPSMTSGLEKAGVSASDPQRYADFNAYLVALRMLSEYDRLAKNEISRPPGPLSRQDYYNYVLEVETANPEFKAGAKDIHDFLKNHAEYMFNNHLLTKAQFDAMMKMENYVPLHRDMTDFVDKEVQLRGSDNPKQLINGFVRRFEGSDRLVISPLESIVKRVTEIEYAIARNNTIRSLAELGRISGYRGGYIAEVVNDKQLKAHEVDVFDALKKLGKDNKVSKTDMDLLLVQAEDLLGEHGTATIFKQETIEPGQRPIVFYWENGQRKALWLHDGKLGQEMFSALTSLNNFETNFLFQTLQMSQAILRSGVTLSLDFPLVNLVRDQMTSALTAGRKYIPFVGVVKGLLETAAANDVEMAKKLGFTGTDAKRFAAMGGTAGGAITNAIDEMGFNHAVTAFMPKGGWTVGGVGRAMVGFTGKAAEFSEVGTRAGLYKAYFEQGKDLGYDDINAALWATFKANDYIDFRRHGNQMQGMRRLVPFLNAALQGTDREVRAVKDYATLTYKLNHGGLSEQELLRLQDARAGMIRLVTLSIVVGGSLAVMNAENPFYQSAPRYVKNLNFILPGSVDENGNAVVIPKGFGVLQAFINSVEMSVEQAYRRDPAIAPEYLKMLGTAFMPPVNNPAVALFYDLPANWNRFRERPIVPYYMRGVDKPDQFNAYTSEFAKLVGRATGQSPMKIEYAINNTFGGLGRDFQFFSDWMTGTQRPEKQIYDYPVVRRFYKNLPRGNQMTAAFYDLVGEGTGSLEAKAQAYALRITAGDRTAAAEIYRNMSDEEKVWTAINKFGFDTNDKRMHPLYRAHDIVKIGNELSRAVTNGNVLKEEDLDRRNLTLSRRDATPIPLTPHQRAKLQEELLEYNMATTRNAMIAIRAPGTNNLERMDVDKVMHRMGLISPDFRKEFEARLSSKNHASEDYVFKNWPEVRRRILRDGEDADISDLSPKKPKRRR